ncbi:hypothetical protein ABVT39_025030 [Epinephelus coioides]
MRELFRPDSVQINAGAVGYFCRRLVVVLRPFMDDKKMATVTGGLIRHTNFLIAEVTSVHPHWLVSGRL